MAGVREKNALIGHTMCKPTRHPLNGQACIRDTVVPHIAFDSRLLQTHSDRTALEAAKQVTCELVMIYIVKPPNAAAVSTHPTLGGPPAHL